MALVGQAMIEGRDVIVAACERRTLLCELAGTTTTFTRSPSAADAGVVVVDADARYVDVAVTPPSVSSCQISTSPTETCSTAITSYAVESSED